MKAILRGGKLYWNNFNRTTNLLGKQMLLARRLCEAGCGFVTVVDSCWDFHDAGNNPPVKTGMEVLSPQADHAISAFLQDVEERGLSDKILLIVTAEMGRSRIKGGKSGGGSGHWGELTPLLLAGGGLKMGQVIGASDRTGRWTVAVARHCVVSWRHVVSGGCSAGVSGVIPKPISKPWKNNCSSQLCWPRKKDQADGCHLRASEGSP